MFSAVLSDLTKHYQAIETLVGRSEVLLATDTPDLEAIAKLRWEEVRALREYQLFKHLRIFAPAIAEGGITATMSRGLEADCIAAGEEFRAHIIRWSGCVPASDWSAYRYAARSMMDRVRRHIQAEKRAIESLLTMRTANHAAAQAARLNRSSVC